MGLSKHRGFGMERRRRRTAYLFLSPWLIGFTLFFLRPLVETIRYSFGHLQVRDTGGMELLPLEGGPFANFIEAFTKDPNFVRLFTEGLRDLALQVPAIVIFSAFIALLLNQEFIGRTFMRGMFFLPVIITTGMISSIIRDSLNNVAQGSMDSQTNIFQSTAMTAMLTENGLPDGVTQVITTLINNSVDVVWQSGIQILIFLSGMLAIPAVYYEVASVEGATKWEAFWRITFPLIRPYILVNIIYSMIDIFSSYDNEAMQYMVDMVYQQMQFSLGSAMSWVYFLTVMLIIGVVTLLLRDRTYSRTRA